MNRSKKMILSATLLSLLTSIGISVVVDDAHAARKRHGNAGRGQQGSTPSTDEAAPVRFKRVPIAEFTPTAVPQTLEERTQVYTQSKVRLTHAAGSTEVKTLKYNNLFQTGDMLNGMVAGGLYDVRGEPILDKSASPSVSQFFSDNPDGTTIFRVSITPTEKGGNPLYMINHYESVSKNNVGQDMYQKLPMAMSLSFLNQDKATGELSVLNYRNIDVQNLRGLWNPCAAISSPWNTHLGSEEYEPDARAFESGRLKLTGMNTYFGSDLVAKPYHYGQVPEVTVGRDGSTKAVKHYALGRISREMVRVMPDRRTMYMSDDGRYTGFFMFIADKPADLSAGTLYAAKWIQLNQENGGIARLVWVKLGHGVDRELEEAANSLKFSDMFDVATQDTPGFTKVQTDKGIEWLRVKPGMEKIAAFLETRRYAALVGATTEFNKMEGLTVNKRDKKLYMSLSSIDNGMLPDTSAPADHIQLPRSKAGGVYELSLARAIQDTKGGKIASNFVATTIRGLVMGEDLAQSDAVGNTANLDKVSNPDNLAYSENLRTLFIGEDSEQHVNNFVWAYHVDSKKLVRILSLPAGAESAGLLFYDNVNGHSYLTVNYQHPGALDQYTAMPASLKAELKKRIQPKKGGVGYISQFPILN